MGGSIGASLISRLLISSPRGLTSASSALPRTAKIPVFSRTWKT